MSADTANPPLLGYSDVMSVCPGGTIAFKVSSAASAPFSARLLRSISADPNPAGPGIIEEDASKYFAPSSFPSQHQPFYPGSYGRAAEAVALSARRELRFQATLFPTRACAHPQTILSVGGLDLALDGTLRLALRRDGETIATGPQLKLREWAQVAASIAPGEITLSCTQLSTGKTFFY